MTTNSKVLLIALTSITIMALSTATFANTLEITYPATIQVSGQPAYLCRDLNNDIVANYSDIPGCIWNISVRDTSTLTAYHYEITAYQNDDPTKTLGIEYGDHIRPINRLMMVPSVLGAYQANKWDYSVQLGNPGQFFFTSGHFSIYGADRSNSIFHLVFFGRELGLPGFGALTYTELLSFHTPPQNMIFTMAPAFSSNHKKSQ